MPKKLVYLKNLCFNRTISYLLLLVVVTGIVSSLIFLSPPTDAASSTNTSYKMKVLVVKYFPLTANGQNIDINVTGDIGDPYTTIRQRTINIDNNLIKFLPKATSYLGYKNSTAQPALTYSIVATKEFTKAVPIASRSGSPRYPDYNGIMTSNNICNYVDSQGVREVWLWAYQGPNKADGQPYLGILESKMSGPFGDISNSDHYNDMPICQHTYRVYTFNYGRGTGEAVHSWGHQIEVEVDAINRPLFRQQWQGTDASFAYSYYPQTLGVNGRCGNIHNPPNARSEYDWANPTPQNSDCLNWNADSIGTLSPISCQNWGCNYIDDTNNSQLNYIVWNLQNIPGRNNTKTYQGQPMRNWWDVHGNFDAVMASDKTLVLNPHPTPTPTPAPFPAGSAPHSVPGVIQAEDYDLGGEGIAYHDLTPTNEGGAYRPNEGVDVEATGDIGGGFDVAFTQPSEWLNYSIKAPATGTYTLSARVASAGIGGTFHIMIDKVNVTGTMSVPDTSGWQNYQTITSPKFTLQSGNHSLKLMFDSAGQTTGWVGNFNYLSIN